MPAAALPNYRRAWLSSSIIDHLLDCAAKFAARPMLATTASQQSYDQIWSQVLRLASVLIEETGEQNLIGFLAERDPSAYLAILSILAAGKGYVPLNPGLPDARLARIVREAQLKTVIVGSGQAARAASLIASSEGVRLLIDLDGANETSDRHGRRIIGNREIACASAAECAAHLRCCDSLSAFHVWQHRRTKGCSPSPTPISVPISISPASSIATGRKTAIPRLSNSPSISASTI